MRLVSAALIVGLVLPVSAALADGFALKTKPKIAFIYFNSKSDGGWTQSFDEAKSKIDAATGQNIPYVENIPEVAGQIRPAVERFIQRGYNVIIGTAYGYADTFKELSQEHPDVAFLNSNGTATGPNLETFYGRTYESQYLCGMAAAGASKTGKLGFVAPHPIGPVNWSINAYALGARSINPNATVTVIFTGAWNDPVKERSAASALIDQGIDVVGQSVDTPTAQIVAQERGVFGTGNWRDMREFAPKATQCSQVWTWANFLIPEIESIEKANWKPDPNGVFRGAGPTGITDIACCGAAVPDDVKKKILAAREALIKGERKVFAGPLSDTSGKEQVPAGKDIADAQLWTMKWYVPGVIASVK
jgi:basic membrane protein A and related proteins